MTTYILDLEGNGLREDITKIHCIVAKSLNSKQIYRFYNELYDESRDKDYALDRFPRLIRQCTKLIGHNILGYDIPVLEWYFKLDLSNIQVVDTYVISQLLDPDRQLPAGCPTSTPNPLTGNQDKIGPHSLEAHGFRLGYQKIHHHDWREFSIEMLNRCESDVIITEAVYYDFMKQLTNE